MKERLVGATLLVVAGIVFIPWLLDGRTTTRPVTQTLPLPQGGDTAPRTRTIPLVDSRRQSQVPAQPEVAPPDSPDELPRPQQERQVTPAPVAVAAPTVRSAPAATTAGDKPAAASAAPRASAPATPAPAAAAPAPVSSDPVTGWAVQVGAFSSQSNATRLAERLSGMGYKAFVSRKVVDGRVLYRVRVGPEESRAAAEELGARLKADKQPVRVVEHPG